MAKYSSLSSGADHMNSVHLLNPSAQSGPSAASSQSHQQSESSQHSSSDSRNQSKQRTHQDSCCEKDFMTDLSETVVVTTTTMIGEALGGTIGALVGAGLGVGINYAAVHPHVVIKVVRFLGAGIQKKDYDDYNLVPNPHENSCGRGRSENEHNFDNGSIYDGDWTLGDADNYCW